MNLAVIGMALAVLYPIYSWSQNESWSDFLKGWTYPGVAEIKLDNEPKKALIPICRQMQGELLPQVRYLRDLRSRLKALLPQAQVPDISQQIFYLMSEIRTVSKSIENLSRVEWNSEVYDLNLSWKIPREKVLTGEKEYREKMNDLKHEIYPTWNMERDSSGRILLGKVAKVQPLSPMEMKNFFTQKIYEFSGITVESVHFMGERKDEIQRYIFHDANRNNSGDITISYIKKATAVEICQLLTTLHVAVTVHFNTGELVPENLLRGHLEPYRLDPGDMSFNFIVSDSEIL